jgi:hypothetical protein
VGGLFWAGYRGYPFARLIYVICTRDFIQKHKEGNLEQTFGKEGKLEGMEGKVKVVNIYIYICTYI